MNKKPFVRFLIPMIVCVFSAGFLNGCERETEKNVAQKTSQSASSTRRQEREQTTLDSAGVSDAIDSQPSPQIDDTLSREGGDISILEPILRDLKVAEPFLSEFYPAYSTGDSAKMLTLARTGSSIVVSAYRGLIRTTELMRYYNIKALVYPWSSNDYLTVNAHEELASVIAELAPAVGEIRLSTLDRQKQHRALTRRQQVRELEPAVQFLKDFHPLYKRRDFEAIVALVHERLAEADAAVRTLESTLETLKHPAVLGITEDWMEGEVLTEVELIDMMVILAKAILSEIEEEP